MFLKYKLIKFSEKLPPFLSPSGLKNEQGGKQAFNIHSLSQGIRGTEKIPRTPASGPFSDYSVRQISAWTLMFVLIADDKFKPRTSVQEKNWNADSQEAAHEVVWNHSLPCEVGWSLPHPSSHLASHVCQGRHCAWPAPVQGPCPGKARARARPPPVHSPREGSELLPMESPGNTRGRHFKLLLNQSWTPWTIS